MGTRRIAAAAARRIAAEEAAGFVTSGMWIDYGAALCQPDVFDAALARRKDELQRVKIRACLTMRPRAVLEATRPASTSSGSTGTSPATTAGSTTRGRATTSR